MPHDRQLGLSGRDVCTAARAFVYIPLQRLEIFRLPEGSRPAFAESRVARGTDHRDVEIPMPLQRKGPIAIGAL